MKKTLAFPPGFLWGAATASHQIEGNQYNDWSVWEQKNASRLATESEKNFWWNPHWKKFKHEATNPENYISGVACDSWNRFEEDFNIVQFLGLRGYRFSIEWSRIEPTEGVFDEVALSRYRAMILSLRKRNIEPFITLWHWTLPVWLSEKGGTTAKDFPEYFKKYTQKVVSYMGNDATYWVTLNEPDVQTSHAYLKGAWPPQQRSVRRYFKALHNLTSAHTLAYAVIKQKNTYARVGIAKHQVAFEMARPTIINRILKAVADYFWNDYFLKRITQCQDFIGLNHYNRNVIDRGYGKNRNLQQTDFGWEFYPESIYQALLELKKYNKPIYITENGIADSFDTKRKEFIQRSLASVHRAIADGVRVRGYFYWSLLDNFEWDKGFWLRFGLVSVNRNTQERTIRDSAYLYKKMAEDNSLQIEITS